MSVTISIGGNRDYCIQNNLIQYDEYPCICAWNDNEADPACPDCKGTGIERFEVLPFELNVANGNFHMLWSALGLECDYCGSMHPHLIATILRSFDPELLRRADRVEQDNGPMVVHCGTTPEQVQRYIETLTEIVNEAERREELIIWG